MLQWSKFTAEEKIKCMDKMIAYIKKNCEDQIYDKSNTRDVYSLCRCMGCTTLYEFMVDHANEV